MEVWYAVDRTVARQEDRLIGSTARKALYGASTRKLKWILLVLVLCLIGVNQFSSSPFAVRFVFLCLFSVSGRLAASGLFYFTKQATRRLPKMFTSQKKRERVKRERRLAVVAAAAFADIASAAMRKLKTPSCNSKSQNNIWWRGLKSNLS